MLPLKKNPFLSMWLSGANATMGHGRSRALAAMRRQSAAMTSQFMQDSMRIWTVHREARSVPKDDFPSQATVERRFDRVGDV